MDHSLQGYLERQATDRLLMLLEEYAPKEDEYNKSIYEMLLDILTRRGVL